MDWNAVAGVAPPVDEAAVEFELVEYVAGRDLPATVTEWTISTPGQADWAMTRLADAREYQQQMQDQATLWQEATARVRSAGAWFEAKLQDWALLNRTKDRKSFPLAHGTIGTTERKPSIEVSDEDAAIEWAKNTVVPVPCPDCEGAGDAFECERCGGSRSIFTPIASLGAVKYSEEFRISVAKDHLHIGELVIAWLSRDKTTGEAERINVDPPTVFVQDELDRVQVIVGDSYVVEAEVVPAVLDARDQLVPGMRVKPGSVTATVRPLGL